MALMCLHYPLSSPSFFCFFYVFTRIHLAFSQKKHRGSLEPATNDLLSSFSIHLFIDQTQKEKLNNIEHI